MRQVKDVTFILLILLNVLVVARAQTSSTATVSGTVSDAQGAVVAGAIITLVDVTTNQERKSASNDAGQYQFLAVQPGVYTISVTMPGFRQWFVRDVKVDVSKACEVNVRLEVGAVTEKVEVVVSAGTELRRVFEWLSCRPGLLRRALAFLSPRVR